MGEREGCARLAAAREEARNLFRNHAAAVVQVGHARRDTGLHHGTKDIKDMKTPTFCTPRAKAIEPAASASRSEFGA